MDRRVFLVSGTACLCCGVASAETQGVSQTFDLCTQMPEPSVLSRRYAVENWDGNRVQNGDEATLLRAKRWNPAMREMRVAFTSRAANSGMKQRIISAARIWEAHMPLKFKFDAQEPHIRIDTKPGGGHWSYVGTDSGYMADRGEVTMNLGWHSPPRLDREVRRVVLHEFGHAMGLVHEHQHPSASISWNKQAVFDHYKKTNGWNEEKTTRNVLNQRAGHEVLGTDYDPESIMHYAVPRSLVTDAADVTGWSYSLSPSDKAMIAWMWKV